MPSAPSKPNLSKYEQAILDHLRRSHCKLVTMAAEASFSTTMANSAWLATNQRRITKLECVRLSDAGFLVPLGNTDHIRTYGLARQ